MLYDNVRCIHRDCGFTALVKPGSDSCPTCRRRGTLAWVEGEPKQKEQEEVAVQGLKFRFELPSQDVPLQGGAVPFGAIAVPVEEEEDADYNAGDQYDYEEDNEEVDDDDFYAEDEIADIF